MNGLGGGEMGEQAGRTEEPQQKLSRTAPGRLEAFDNDSEDEHTNLKKVISFHENRIGNFS